MRRVPDLRGRAGFLVDAYRLAGFELVRLHSCTDFRHIEAFRHRFDSAVFIKTATYRGLSARRCADTFASVYSPKLDAGPPHAAARRSVPRRVRLAGRRGRVLSPRVDRGRGRERDCLFGRPLLWAADGTVYSALLRMRYPTSSTHGGEPARMRRSIIDDARSVGWEPQFLPKLQVVWLADVALPATDRARPPLSTRVRSPARQRHARQDTTGGRSERGGARSVRQFPIPTRGGG